VVLAASVEVSLVVADLPAGGKVSLECAPRELSKINARQFYF
jgi:hypothetical protein